MENASPNRRIMPMRLIYNALWGRARCHTQLITIDVLPHNSARLFCLLICSHVSQFCWLLITVFLSSSSAQSRDCETLAFSPNHCIMMLNQSILSIFHFMFLFAPAPVMIAAASARNNNAIMQFCGSFCALLANKIIEKKIMLIEAREASSDDNSTNNNCWCAHRMPIFTALRALCPNGISWLAWPPPHALRHVH